MLKLNTLMRGGERDALNLIRWLSAIAIVVCHILQAYGNIFAYTFNVGVQVFFLLSGFLYGGRHIVDIKKFYWGRIKKLYIPFALWCIISAILLYISIPHRISWSALFLQLAMYRCMPGQEHLWFMQVIFVCYLLVPLVDFVLTKNVPIPVILAVTFWGIVLHVHYTPTLIWIALYFIGYAMGRWRNTILYFTSVSIISTICLSIFHGGLVQSLADPQLIGTLSHATFGITVYCLFLIIMREIKIPSIISKTIELPGAYEIYLVHPLFLMGPFALLKVTEYQSLNISLSIFAIVLTSAVFYCLSKYIISKI